ncbi:MAG: hypothetical protein KDI67_10460, partial [Gammaproteobacteria bacterium]|nr:hypothetical protein [Gammaproteobacteria bacterium]
LLRQAWISAFSFAAPGSGAVACLTLVCRAAACVLMRSHVVSELTADPLWRLMRRQIGVIYGLNFPAPIPIFGRSKRL